MGKRKRISATVVNVISVSVLLSSCSLFSSTKDISNEFRNIALADCDAEAVSGEELENLFSYWNTARQSEIDSLCEYEMANVSVLYHDDIARSAVLFPDFVEFYESQPQGLFAEYDSDDRLDSQGFFDIELNDYEHLGVLMYFDYDVSSISDFEETIVMVYELESNEAANEDFQYYIDCIEDLYYLESDDFNNKEYALNENNGFFIYHCEGDMITDSIIGLMEFDTDDFHCDEAVYWVDNYVIVLRSVGFSDSAETAVIDGLELESPANVQNSREVGNSYNGVADIMLARLYREYLFDHVTYISSEDIPSNIIEDEEGIPVSLDSLRDGGSAEITPTPTPGAIAQLPLIIEGEDFDGTVDIEGDGTSFPIAMFEVSANVPYEQHWPNIFAVYGITDVVDASDPRAQIIIEYTGLDPETYVGPSPGDHLLLPPLGVITGEIENDFSIRGN